MAGINSLTGLPDTLYRIYDTVEKKYWQNNNGKSVWFKPGHAKNAWNAAQPGYCNYFNDQTRYVVHGFMATGWNQVL